MFFLLSHGCLVVHRANCIWVLEHPGFYCAKHFTKQGGLNNYFYNSIIYYTPKLILREVKKICDNPTPTQLQKSLIFFINCSYVFDKIMKKERRKQKFYMYSSDWLFILDCSGRYCLWTTIRNPIILSMKL